MYTRLGLINGEIKVSDVWSNEQIESHIAEYDGRLGTGDFAQARVENVEDAMAFIERIVAMALDDRAGGTVTIVVNGEPLEYKSREIAWYRTIR